ncbi:transposable element Tcb1 transposase [Trichonephila clavipes]|nr:transposable element Tcb1 transposase [Trichonephila clavipes]
MSRRKQRSASDQVSEFYRGRIVAYRDCGLSFRKIGSRVRRNQTTQSGLSARHPLFGLPLTQNHRRLHRQWCDARRIWATKWNKIVFTDELRIFLQHHDGRIRVWRHRGERMRGGIGYHSRTPLVRIAGTLNRQHYISEVLEPVVLPYFQGLATAIFQQDSA